MHHFHSLFWVDTYRDLRLFIDLHGHAWPTMHQAVASSRHILAHH